MLQPTAPHGRCAAEEDEEQGVDPTQHGDLPVAVAGKDLLEETDVRRTGDGSIDTDGCGTLMATSECLLSLNRNEYLSREEIEAHLSRAFGLRRILWLDHGGIIGDDTDSHVDILARFCSPDTIAFTACDNPSDDNYVALKAMEEQLRTFRTLDGKPYNLVPLPLPEPLYLDDYRLPASYANFLVVNGAVLMPGAGSALDEVAASRLRSAFPGRTVEVIDCRALLSGHGGLHCITMNYPEGF